MECTGWSMAAFEQEKQEKPVCPAPRLILGPWSFLSYCSSYSGEDVDRRISDTVSVVYNKITQKPPARTLWPGKLCLKRCLSNYRYFPHLFPQSWPCLSDLQEKKTRPMYPVVHWQQICSSLRNSRLRCQFQMIQYHWSSLDYWSSKGCRQLRSL